MTPSLIGTLILIVAVLVMALVISMLNRRIAQLKAGVIKAEEHSLERIKEMTAKFEEERRQLSNRHSEEMAALRHEHDLELRQLKEHIERNREAFRKMDEKTLLVEIMDALGSYSARMDRLENTLNAELVNERIATMTKEFSEQIDGLAITLENRMESVGNAVEESISDLDVTQLMSMLESIDGDTSSIKKAISGIEDTMDTDGISSLSFTVSSIEDAVDSIQSDVSVIKSRVSDPYDYESLRYAVDSAGSNAEAAKSAAEEAKSAAEDAKYAVESHF